MDCHFLLQWIFPTQGWNPGFPRCRQTLYHLSHQGSPREIKTPPHLCQWIDKLLLMLSFNSTIQNLVYATRKPISFLRTSGSRLQNRRMCSHLLLWKHQNRDHLFNTIEWRTLEPTKKHAHLKTKKKLQQDGKRPAITIKSNPITTKCIIHELENNNMREVLPLLWRFWTPYQASQPGDLTKELGIPRESDLKS